MTVSPQEAHKTSRSPAVSSSTPASSCFLPSLLISLVGITISLAAPDWFRSVILANSRPGPASSRLVLHLA